MSVIASSAIVGARVAPARAAVSVRSARAVPAAHAFAGKRMSVAATRRVVMKAEVEDIDADAGDLGASGEWPTTLAYSSYEELHDFYADKLFKEEIDLGDMMVDVMSPPKYTATADQKLSEIEGYFAHVTGVPVIDAANKVVGVLSKKDVPTAQAGSTVGDVMSSPAQTIAADKDVNSAAAMMLKYKVHRLPVVNNKGILIGVVSRTDIFTALEK